MPPVYPSPTMQDIRAHARPRYWKRFDEIIETLIAMDASPIDLEERLQSRKKPSNESEWRHLLSTLDVVLDGMLGKREENHRAELDGAVSEVDPDSAPKGASNSMEPNPNSAIVVEDDDKQPRVLPKIPWDIAISLGNSPTMSKGQRKRKATGTIDAKKLGRKRLIAKTIIQPESQESGPVGSGASQDPSTEVP